MSDLSDDSGDDVLNQYGDAVIETTGRHGADISSQRLDALDEAAMRYALDALESDVTAIDIGCGLGAQGIRFGLLGIETTLVDTLDISPQIDVLQETFDICELRFLNKDAANVTAADLPERIEIAYSQRSIHYLEFDDAAGLLDLIADQMILDGRVFISASGLHTELGDGYPHRDRPLDERYAKLDPEMREKHDIRDRICLYTVEDMERLLTAAGITPVQVERSEFGNIKAIGERN